MPELVNGTVLKIVVLQGTGGSNPSLRANTNILKKKGEQLYHGEYNLHPYGGGGHNSYLTPSKGGIII